MDAEALQARIDEIERVLYHPRNYAVNVINPSSPGQCERQTVSELAAELNHLRAEQIRRCSAKFGRLAPVGGLRLSTGELPRPEPPDDDMPSEVRADPMLRHMYETGEDWG